MKQNVAVLFLLLFIPSQSSGQEIITFGTLIDEMTDLERLTYLPNPSYRMIQFSSYDRRSKTPGQKGWFANSDGFGNEPIPGFQNVLNEPDTNGIGTYLVCDVQGPGTILRLWTAGINGKIRCFLDNMDLPVYEGEAEDFFWDTGARLSGNGQGSIFSAVFRQFDASYFPIPFSDRCRIEWIGNIREIHFYHIGIRIYETGTAVRTFRTDDLEEQEAKIQKVKAAFSDPDLMITPETAEMKKLGNTLPAHSEMELLKMEGTHAIDNLSLKIAAEDIESALRECVLNIYFDDAVVPQVQSPLGDFFGAAPGLNPFESYPFSVRQDSTLICRFIMPFQNSVRIVLQNNSDSSIPFSGHVYFSEYDWKDGVSMHFRARWRIDHGLIASKTSIIDVPYGMIIGKGRVVGAAAFIYNPSEAVTSWGNWWGEGDEKIFIDGEEFPSFFGTGSEDYFNYSWSSEKFFSFPYCGQPRNDGPGNRGYVANFRWHINDDLFFNEKIAFYMELFHHGEVKDFSYGRIVYAYTLPGCIDDFVPVTISKINRIPYLSWKPEAYLGSAGFRFIQAEKIVEEDSNVSIEKGKLWSEGHILKWTPKVKNEKIQFGITKAKAGNAQIGLTLAHMPGAGKIIFFLNGEILEMNNSEFVDLEDSQRMFLRNYFSKTVAFNEGINVITLKYISEDPGKIIGVDFFWLKEK